MIGIVHADAVRTNIREILCPALPPGDIVVMDNLSRMSQVAQSGRCAQTGLFYFTAGFEDLMEELDLPPHREPAAILKAAYTLRLHEQCLSPTS